MVAAAHPPVGVLPSGPLLAKARKKFLRFFPKGFADATYLAWERQYKLTAHEQWQAALGPARFAELLAVGRHDEIAAAAVRIESRTNLLFSFEKMALRDALRTPSAQRTFAEALHALLHGGLARTRDPLADRFTAWVDAIASLPRRQTRVLTWPLATVFPFLAQPAVHFFLKPLVTRRAFDALGVPFPYRSRPDAETYTALLAAVASVRRALAALDDKLRARDQIDMQSFLWVQGSDEYD